MIENKLWKDDLAQIIKDLSLWSNKNFKRYKPKAEHIINRGFLYSAIIIRKAIEDEKGAKPYVEQRGNAKKILKTLYYEIPVITYSFLQENTFVNKRVIPEFYDIENAEEMNIGLEKVCNQIIHSYKWSVLYDSEMNGIYGVLFVSDRFKGKCVYLLKIEDWINAIQFVIDNYCF